MISPGEDIQPIVNALVPGISYLLLSGVHQMQSVELKDGDSYTDESGTVMFGAVRLGPLVSRKGHWLAVAPTLRRTPG